MAGIRPCPLLAALVALAGKAYALELRGAVRGSVGSALAAGAQQAMRGVRDQPPAVDDHNPEGFSENELDRNDWLGASQAYDFRVMDDLEPVAPMDQVAQTGPISPISPESLPAEHHNSLYLPPYRNPDTFPAFSGPRCICTKPKFQQVTQQDQAWFEDVRRWLGRRMPASVKPIHAQRGIQCECEQEPQGGPLPHDWSRIEAVPGSADRFVLAPADSTFPAGDYWEPGLRGGLAAPADVLPLRSYPVQAKADRIRYIPAAAREDRVAVKFARYMDQIEARAQECEGDGVSERCTTACRPGDHVVAEIGPTRFNATVVSTHTRGAVVVELLPAASRGRLGAVACPFSAGCSVFRPCIRRPDACVEEEATVSHDYLGRLQRELSCPRGAQICATVQQALEGRYLRKGGRACRAGRPIVDVADVMPP